MLVGIAALVVFAGLMILGGLTSPDPAAVEETTTTTVEEVDPPIDPENFTVDQIATGDPLEWELVMAIDDRYPLELIEHGGDIYLFTDSEHPGGPDSSGLMAWRSSDGTNWEVLGEMISSEHRITTVHSTMQGLVVTAIRREDGAFVLWRSKDATEWTATEVPTGTEGPYDIDIASAVAADETTLLIASNARYDRERLLEDRLRATGIEIDLSELYWSLRWLGAEGQHLFVTLPLGIPVLQIPIDALGLRDEERQEVTGEIFDPIGTDVRVLSENKGWESGFIGDTWTIDSIVPTPDGRFLAYGQGVSGQVSKITADGIEWTPTGSVISPSQAGRWRQRYVGVINAPELMVSEDGQSWQSAGLDERFPDELSWAPTTLGAGEGGVAVFVRGDQLRSRMRLERVVELTADDGARFLLVQRGGDFVLSSDSGRGRWVLNAGGDSIEVDMVERRVSLSDPDSGEEEASFTFAELQRASREHSSHLIDTAGSWNVMAFTEDGQEWVIQDMAPEIGDHATIWLLEVTEERIVAVVRNTLDALIRGGSPGLEIWSAPLP